MTILDERRAHFVGGALRRAIPVLVAVALPMIAYRLGVGVTERPGLPQASWLTHLYYTLGLFVFGGLDLGVPTGGSAAGRALLWVGYFLAPLITITSVVEGFLRAYQPWWAQRLQRDHVVLVGLGRTGLLYLEALREVDPDRVVLVVALSRDSPNVVEATERFGARVIIGDITHRAIREILGLRRAHGVVLLTKNDLTNLAAASDITREYPNLAGRVVVHLGDLAMKSGLAAQLRGGFAGAMLPVPTNRVFNAHNIAANHLVLHELEGHFQATTGQDVVVLCGFGRFGQTILEALQREVSGEFQRVVVVDSRAALRVRQFEQRVGVAHSHDFEVVSGCLDDPEVEDALREAAHPGADAPAPVYILGTDDDRTNLQTAIRLRDLEPDARVVVRCSSDSAFIQQLAQAGGFEIFAISALLKTSFVDLHREWFR